MKNLNVLQNETVKQLHQTVIDAIHKAKAITKNHLNTEEERPTLGEKFSDIVFNIGSSWAPILFFTSIVITWVIFNLFVTEKYRFDPSLSANDVFAGRYRGYSSAIHYDEST